MLHIMESPLVLPVEVKCTAYRADQMGGLRTGIRPVHIAATSKMVTDFSGMPIQPHKVSLLSRQLIPYRHHRCTSACKTQSIKSCAAMITCHQLHQ